MKRPLLWPAVGFAAGILLAEFSTLETAWFVVAGIAGAAGSYQRRWLTGGCWLLLFLASGGLAYRGTQLPLDETELRWQLAGNAGLGTVQGTLEDTPTVRVAERHGELIERTVVRLRVHAWRPQNGDWSPASGTLAVSSKGVPDGRYFRGQRVEISGVVSRPPAPAARGLFDYGTFLRRQGVGLQLLCEAPLDWALAANSEVVPPLSERFLYQLR